MSFVKMKGGDTCKVLGMVPYWVNDQKTLAIVSW